MKYLTKLHKELVDAGIPISGVYEKEDTTAGIHYNNASPVQIAQAELIVAAFDDSDSGFETWKENLEPDYKDLKAQADSAIATNTTFLALSSPTNAQNAAQVKALTQQNQRIIKALRRLLT